jgi:hypothetical protein
MFMWNKRTSLLCLVLEEERPYVVAMTFVANIGLGTNALA